jgi:D-lactate dehydrogenase
MCCGTSQNSYKTVADIRVIFNDGSLLDTADEKSKEDFSRSHPQIVDRLSGLSQKIKLNPEISGRIRRKYKIKNTTGYSLNALVDFSDPIDIIKHIMIGSEGTLGFISNITYKTVEEYSNRATALLLFPGNVEAAEAVALIKAGADVSAVELMDRAALRSVEDKPGMPLTLKTLPEGASSLLVETRGETKEQLENNVNSFLKLIAETKLLYPAEFTSDKAEYERLWDIRNGLLPSVGAMRKTGTTVIIEDIAFEIEKLAPAIDELQKLFHKHGYDDAIIFGHALEGNIHFVFKQDFNSAREIARYKDFIDDVTSMVVKKFDGALKAEHGTGRNMAPFVELEWGREAYLLMKEIKNIFDPEGLMNPGVILTEDKNTHVKNLKPMPAADPVIDKCVECGFCEVNCPSKELTLSPRQRTVIWREIARLKAMNTEPHRLASLMDAYSYYGDETCATDGLCASGCPVDINTGTLIKHLRADKLSPQARSIAQLIAGNYSFVTGIMRFGLNIVDLKHKIFGTAALETVFTFLRKISFGKLPLWNRYMPKGADKIKIGTVNDENTLKVVYFPSCINRTMGVSKYAENRASLTTITSRLLTKAGYEIIYPEGLSDLCCGMPFASKGYKQEGDMKSDELKKALLAASSNGKYPVLFDMSPCLYRMKEYLSSNENGDSVLSLFEPVEFVYKFLSDKLKFNKLKKAVALHNTCSSTKMGLADMAVALSHMCAEEVIIPDGVGCCAWAGDRGFSYPELNASALRNLKDGIPGHCHEGYSTSRTCEIGLSLHSGINYESILNLVDEATEKLPQLS